MRRSSSTTPPSDLGGIAAVPEFSSDKVKSAYHISLHTDGMPERTKVVAYKVFKVHIGLDLWSRRTWCNDERCCLGELRTNCVSFVKTLIYVVKTYHERRNGKEYSPYESFR